MSFFPQQLFITFVKILYDNIIVLLTGRHGVPVMHGNR